jgi:DHA2 family multidrug resistance protein
MGYVFLSTAVIAALTALSNGQVKGWQSDYIHVCEALTVVGLVMFICVELGAENPLLDLRLMLVRNYTLSILLAVFRAVGLFGSIFLFPIFLQTITGYTPVQAGLWMLPNAAAVGLTMPLAGRLADRYSPALLATIGCVTVGLSLILFGALDPLSGWPLMVLPQVGRGAGLALMMAPLMTAALNAVPQREVPMASSFLNVFQNVGGSLGIAVLNTYVTDSIHRHAVRLGEELTAQSQRFDVRLGLRAASVVFHHEGAMVANPQSKLVFAANEAIGRRALTLGFENGFVLAGLILLAGIPLCLMLKPAPHHLAKEEESGGAVEAEYVAE